jgi:hypothetical protein
MSIFQSSTKDPMMHQAFQPQAAVLCALTDETKDVLYTHFAGAADPDRLIYIAWMFANGWLHDDTTKYNQITDPKNGMVCTIEVLKLDNDTENFGILYEHWRMGEVIAFLFN